MPELWHDFGFDLIIGPTGDIDTASGADEGRQRVLRRLMTAAHGYIWHLNYGAGLPEMIGKPARQNAIKAVIVAQMKLERAVMQSPPPSVSVQVNPDNTVFATINYVDAPSGLPQTLAFPVA